MVIKLVKSVWSTTCVDVYCCVVSNYMFGASFGIAVIKNDRKSHRVHWRSRAPEHSGSFVKVFGKRPASKYNVKRNVNGDFNWNLNWNEH